MILIATIYQLLSLKVKQRTFATTISALRVENQLIGWRRIAYNDRKIKLENLDPMAPLVIRTAFPNLIFRIRFAVSEKRFFQD